MPFKLNGLMIESLKFVQIKTKDAIVEKVKVLLCKLCMLMRCWSDGLKFIIRSPVSQLGGSVTTSSQIGHN